MTDVLQAQSQLAVTLARAKSEEDRELLNVVRDQGGQVAHLLNGLLRMAHLHAPNNDAFDAPVRDFGRGLHSLIELIGPVYLACAEDQVYVNEARIRTDVQVDDNAALGNELGRHNIGGLTFNQPLSGGEIRTVVWIFAEAPAAERPRTTVQRKLVAAGLPSIQVHPPFRFRMSGAETEAMSAEYNELYSESAGVIADVFANLGASRLPNPLPARRLLIQMLDTGSGQDITALARENEQRLPPFARHTMMVTTLAVMLGRAAGLPDASVADLGVAAMFHDVGFSLREDGYTVPYPRHTVAGLKILLKQRGFHKAKVRRLLAVLQHHRSLHDPLGTPTLFARIIHVADDYDILTRVRPGQGPALTPPEAIARMAGLAGKVYDPLFMQLLINALGPLPPGSLLQLTDGHVVVVASGVRSSETFDRPLARILRRPDGSKPLAEAWLDLATAAPVQGVLRPTA
jgi:hypothetical protein